MKKFSAIILLVLLAGCSSPAAEAPTAAPTEVPATETAAPEPTATLVPTPDMGERDTVVSQLFVNPTVVFSEDQAAMADNEGGQFGFIEGKHYNADENVFEFTAGGEGYFGLNTVLPDFGGGFSQGMWMKFQPPQNVSGFYINLFNPNEELYINFQDENRPSFVQFSQAYQDRFGGDLALEAGKTYNLVFGLGSNGEFIAKIWEQGNLENTADYYSDLGDALKDTGFKFNMNIPGNDTLKMYQYEVLTFDGIVH
ncbi:MAG: hypothetical protein PWQ55_775 [Chloroflexota bacterium]|nr:hypothetical protein [Chloroflexota bacterium]